MSINLDLVKIAFHEPSANTQAQDGAFAEGGAEGSRRTIFAACRVRGTSCDILCQDRVSHEVVGEGRRRIVFDMEKGLPEFLAACGIRGTSWNIVFRNTVSHEVVGEGPHRVASDVETAEPSKNFLQHAGPMNPQQTLLHMKERLLRGLEALSANV